MSHIHIFHWPADSNWEPRILLSGLQPWICIGYKLYRMQIVWGMNFLETNRSCPIYTSSAYIFASRHPRIWWEYVQLIKLPVHGAHPTSAVFRLGVHVSQSYRHKIFTQALQFQRGQCVLLRWSALEVGRYVVMSMFFACWSMSQWSKTFFWIKEHWHVLFDLLCMDWCMMYGQTQQRFFDLQWLYGFAESE